MRDAPAISSRPISWFSCRLRIIFCYAIQLKDLFIRSIRWADGLCLYKLNEKIIAEKKRIWLEGIYRLSFKLEFVFNVGKNMVFLSLDCWFIA